jgi:hypothetical protein
MKSGHASDAAKSIAAPNGGKSAEAVWLKSDPLVSLLVVFFFHARRAP